MVLENKYEYEPIKTLTGLEANYISIPLSLIKDDTLGNKRVALLAYLMMYKGLNSRLHFSIPSFLKWANYNSDAHKGAINEKILDLLCLLSDLGYVIFYKSTPNKTSFYELQIDSQFIHEECQYGFSLIYLDEIERIIKYKNSNVKDTYLNNFTILLVFAFLRYSIVRRKNELKPEERSPEMIKGRKERIPEAYNGTYKDIANTLGLTERIVSKSVHVLEELGLIVYAEAYRIKIESNDYRTAYTIFANTEKRYKNTLLVKGNDYAWSEIQQKTINIDKHSQYDYALKEKILTNYQTN